MSKFNLSVVCLFGEIFNYSLPYILLPPELDNLLIS